MIEKVLVVGAAGFIGQHLVNRLNGMEIAVSGVDCLLAESYPKELKRQAFNRLGSLPEVTMYALDARDPLPDELFEDVTCLVNLAAMPGLSPSWKQFDLYESCNVTAVQRLAESSLRHELAHFVQISTSSVYGTIAKSHDDSQLNPSSPYGVTKLAGERLVTAYGQSMNLPFSVLRLFSVYGPNQRPDMAFHKICESILHDEVFTIFGDGNQSRTNTFISDVVEAIVRIIKMGPINQSVDVSGSDSASLLESIRLISDHLGREPRLEFDDARPGDQRETVGNLLPMEDLVGYRPIVGIRDGLEAQVAWHLERFQTRLRVSTSSR